MDDNNKIQIYRKLVFNGKKYILNTKKEDIEKDRNLYYYFVNHLTTVPVQEYPPPPLQSQHVHPPSLTRGGGMDLLKGGVLINRIMKKIFINIYKFKDYSSE